MRLEVKLEFFINNIDKKVYVFKIEQVDIGNKKQDIRSKAISISMALFNYINENKIDMLYNIHEISTSQRFKIFIYIFCNEQTKENLVNYLFLPNKIDEVNHLIF